MPDSPSSRLAVLIDADNAQASRIEGLLAEVAKYGVSTVKRIYGDWTSPQLGRWKEVLHTHAINPVQQFAYTKGKNATDSAMIIDAMDLLYTNRFDGFCLVTSDSDFTRLASRLRESGVTVFGFGERKTPESFRSACDKFVYLDVLHLNWRLWGVQVASLIPFHPYPDTVQLDIQVYVWELGVHVIMLLLVHMLHHAVHLLNVLDNPIPGYHEDSLRLIKGLRGTMAAYWALGGLLITSFAFLGVNMFLSGLHSYGEL